LNILVTGCAGFIGSHAVDIFLDSKYNVVGVDCLTYAANIDNLSEAFNNKNFQFYKEDIVNLDRIIHYTNTHNIDWIINFAAETHVDNSILSCDSFIHSNIKGVKSLLECCRKTGSKLLHISTDEVYGSIRSGSFKESDPLCPKNPYSATKAAAEHLVTAYQNTYGVEFLMVRPSNNFGPRQNKEKFIPTILDSILNNQKIPLYGDGKNIRDWLFVKDNVNSIKFILENSKTNQIFNITTKDEKENIEVIKSILKNFNLRFKDAVDFVPDRLGHDFRYSIDNDKLKSIGCDILSNFENNLLETIEFYCR
jgi:dTDP-glucose 4,6-dehydratase